VCYATRPSDGSAVRAALEAACDEFHDVSRLSPPAMASLIERHARCSL
jgi:hypothetical protein